MAKFLWAFLGTLAALLIAGCLALGTASVIGQASAQTTACHAVNQLRAVLVTLVVRGEKSVPTIQYYKQHPAEMARVQANSRAEEQQLQPIPC